MDSFSQKMVSQRSKTRTGGVPGAAHKSFREAGAPEWCGTGHRFAVFVVPGSAQISPAGSGISELVDIKSEKVPTEEIELGPGAVDASLSLANGNLYIQSRMGQRLILEPTSACPEVARNKGAGSNRPPFFVDDRH